jgi:serine/threonine protein kinase/Flp pilus assembly protein TadD
MIEPGKILNQYRLIEKIGAGGMGEVWAAEDSTLKRRVAIKILPPETADHPERRARFTREAQSVAALNHPNIVTIHSVEECDGVHFLTMEYVDGEPLTKRIGKDGLALHDFFTLAIPLADAVAAAHEQGITHRDLKPDNVMVTRDGRVKVLDFGLAKLSAALDGEVGRDTHLPTQTVTKEGRIVGTVNYMSPEQAEGKSTDPRSDVFSLGILIYEMTTGTRPFSGDTAISTITSILRDTPSPVGELRGDLPRHLDRVIRRCLAKEPERRYQSALELRNELEELKNEIESGDQLETPRVAPRVSGESAAPARKGIPPWAIVVIVAIIGLVAIVALERSDSTGPASPGAGDASMAARPASDAQTMIVVLPFENLGNPDDEYFADGITEEITSRLASVEGLGVISRTSAFRYDRSGKTTAQIGEDFGVDYVLEGSVRWAGNDGDSRVRIIPSLVRVADDVGVWSQPFNKELNDVFEAQSEIATKVVAELGVALATPAMGEQERPTDSPTAYQAYLRGLSTKRLSDDRREWTEAAIANFGRATELDPSFALAWAELSIAHSRYHHFGFDRTPERQQLAKRAVDRALEIDPDLPQAYKALGYYHYWSMKDYQPALDAFNIALKGLAGDEELVSGIGYVYRRQGRFEEAAEKLREAARLNPQDATAHRNLGETLACLRRFDEAIDAYEEAIIVGPEQPEPYVALAEVYRTRNGNERRSEEVLTEVPVEIDDLVALGLWDHHMFFGHFDRALASLERATEPRVNPNEYQPIALSMAEAQRLAGRPAEAAPLYRTALAELDREVAERPDDYRIHAARGLALAGLGRNEEAIAAAEHAVEIYSIAKDALAGSTQLENLARVYAITGDKKKAREIAARLLAIPSWETEYSFRHSAYWADLEWE